MSETLASLPRTTNYNTNKTTSRWPSMLDLSYNLSYSKSKDQIGRMAFQGQPRQKISETPSE
jgi:hypothetical protein